MTEPPKLTRLKMVPMSKNELVAVLDDIVAHVKSGDSFEGFLNYLMPDVEEMEKGVEFVVEARYRIGNLMGQGGMRIYGEWVEVEDPAEGASAESIVAALAMYGKSVNLDSLIEKARALNERKP